MSKDDSPLSDSPRQTTAAAAKTQTAEATSRRVIDVFDVEQLYAAVNDAANVGVSIFLKNDGILPRQTFVLSERGAGGQQRPNRGRLHLQKDMNLYGFKGDPSIISIDTSKLPSTSFDGGAVRLSSIVIGLGSNAIEWLTIIGNPDAAGGIGTDLPGTNPTTIRIANVISGETSEKFNSRGIDIRNAGVAMLGRRIDAVIESCEFFGQRQGIRFANFEGVDTAQIYGKIKNNHSHGNRIGCLLANNRVGESRIEVTSVVDTFDGNGAGCIVAGGLVTGSGRANVNTTKFEAIGSHIVNNQGTETDFAVGGLFVVGGLVSNNQCSTSTNTVGVRLEDCLVENNRSPNFIAYGARNEATTNPNIAGTDNTVTIELSGQSASIDVKEIPSQPTEPAGTNTVTVTRL